ncbi:C4-dicarboxylate ABC transporter substrate-binding protein [Motiliproteus coralliicola]|uniref:C4-dicarboxylate ABC transporter substrate-binding protein n=1 Tax=Motiliproteus coralliicola TaxID=2283196 RepID=A0A369WCL6_9GAMM|nr:TRAP transporter substrate-binding protein DctP [Motiliproteus coralliicola]RDE19053.1 C4-dicarboxylate ABC transporter substrate-binding protein [Motiliproteus coralliicola]
MTITTRAKSILSTCVLSAALTLPAAQTTQAAEELMLGHAYPADHIFHMTSTTFMDELKNSGADIEVNYQPGGSLGDWASIFEQSMDGVVPMTMSFGASEYDPRLDLSWLSYVVEDWKQAREVYGPNGKMTDIYNKILGDLDLVVLGVIPTGFGSIAMRKGVEHVPTSFPQDGQNIKMRVPAIPIGIERYKSFGFTPVPMPFSELYTALQLGTIDARGTAPAVEIWQMRDVLESYILTKDYFEHAFWVVNKSWLEDLPEADRNKLIAAADTTMAKVWDEAQAIDEGFLNKVRESGVKVVELSPADMNKAKEILYASEWPYMEGIVGAEIMAKMRDIAGIN